MQRCSLQRLWMTALAVASMLSAATAQAGPTIAPAYQNSLTIQSVTTLAGSPTQMAWGPDHRLYFMTTNAGVHSFAYNYRTQTVSDEQIVVTGISGIGIAFHKNTLTNTQEMYLSSMDGSIHRLTGTPPVPPSTGYTWSNDVRIVTGIPVGDHDIDQMQVKGDTLFVGIGRRTINGRNGDWTSGSLDDYGGKGFWYGGTGKTWGDSAYNGTICWIKNLNHLGNTDGCANTYASTTLTQTLIQNDSSPYDTAADNKLIVHSAGTRNPYGLCLSRNGDLYFTNNFNRVQTMGNGVAGFGIPGDQLDSDFSKDVQDQLFLAKPGADYGYWDSNWDDQSPFMDRDDPLHKIQRSITFDNLYNPGPYTLHDPANPDGLGPSSSPDGCTFWYDKALPAELYANIFIARYNGTITEASPGTASLTYDDLVAVNVSTGKIRRVASGFTNPLAVITDGHNHLLIANYGDGAIYSLHVIGQ